MSRDRVVDAVATHVVPAWWRDAKLGIFVHWTPASVPAFAPVGADMGELLAQRRPDALAWSPYAEWYQNSLRFPESPVAVAPSPSSTATGPTTRSPAIGRPAWPTGSPTTGRSCFAATGARYVVLVTKHHDGYCLWPTEVPNPNRPGWAARRDVVGELAEAVRGPALRFGRLLLGRPRLDLQ